MSKMELEVKVLNIDEASFIKKLEKAGAIFKEKNNQILYTYDLQTIYGRYIDILTQLNNSESKIKYETAISKLKLLFFDFDNLLTETEKKQLFEIIGVNNFSVLLEIEDILSVLNKKELIDYISKFHNNSKKWIRLRQTEKKTTLAVKHILADDGTNLQQMLETEIEVPSIKEANELLEALGFSYKSYQEKRRTTYMLDNFEIDIDTWPGIPTYFEIEGKNEQELEIILNKFGYSMKDTVSCTADDIYLMNGKTMFEKRELRFEDVK